RTAGRAGTPRPAGGVGGAAGRELSGVHAARQRPDVHGVRRLARAALTNCLGAEALVAGVELLDATSGVEDALLARVEGVRGAGDLHVDDGVGGAFELHGLV